MAAETIELPAVGRVDKKYLYAGGALVAGIAGYAWWSARGSSGGGKVPTPILDPNDVIPATGFNPSPTGNATVNVPAPEGLITTNAQWSQQATEKMAGYGFEPMVVASALGKFLQREGLTPVEKTVIQTAIGLLGYPPVGGPFPITLAGAGTPETPPVDNSSRGNVTAAQDGNWQDVFPMSPGKTLTIATGYGRTVLIKQWDFWGVNGKGVGGGGGNLTIQSDKPVWIPVPAEAIAVSMRYSAKEGFAAEVV